MFRRPCCSQFAPGSMHSFVIWKPSIWHHRNWNMIALWHPYCWNEHKWLLSAECHIRVKSVNFGISPFWYESFKPATSNPGLLPDQNISFPWSASLVPTSRAWTGHVSAPLIGLGWLFHNTWRAASPIKTMLRTRKCLGNRIFPPPRPCASNSTWL